MTGEWIEFREVRWRPMTADRVPALPEREALMSVLAEFAGAIAERRPPLTGARAGIRVLELLEAASRSVDDGGTRIPVNMEAGS
jgi:predicted dehydrogenase